MSLYSIMQIMPGPLLLARINLTPPADKYLYHKLSDEIIN